ncbi:hypothetical protein DTO195F2_3964 [Paecilomyces variotii]|nr:hypothetical protein DTO195F2_3964 [Paecilomyces variotii]
MRCRQPRAKLSIFCHGRLISRDELFAYTNGHFLIDEQRQLDRRYVKFNIDALCDVAAVAGDESSRITTIEKMEGGFSKALLMRKENGKEIIAKIPTRIAGPTCLTTASEVGVLEYVRRNRSIPVPRVLSWSSDCTNPVGAEYIIMEKAAGVPLFQRWANMKEIEKLELIKNLTKFEAQLSAIRFPAYGGLYLRADASVLKFHRHLLDERTTISDLGISIAKRELSQISSKRPDRSPMFYQGSVQEQAHLLECTISLMRMLDAHPTLIKSGQPTLWHTDLHMGNIYVAPNESSQIVSMIDFQSLSVLPAFLQGQWPIFLKPPHSYIKGLVQPKLPDEFDELVEDSKLLAQREWSQAKLAKAYEVSTYLEDRVAHEAMNVPRVFRELFIRCGEVSEVGVIPLRACLIEIFQNWSTLGFTGQCPFSFTEEEIDTHEQQFLEYQAWHEVQRLAWECLDTDAEGWVAPEVDIAEKRKQNKELLSMFIERMAGEKSPEEAMKMWPFPDEA